MRSGTSGVAVYTVAVDREVSLPPAPKLPGVDFICFAGDDGHSNTNGWELMPLEGFAELDSPRLSRLPKALPHLFLPRHEISIYIDSSVQLKVDFANRIHDGGNEVRLSMVQLSRNLGQEFDAVATRRYDSLYHLAEQEAAYSISHPEFRKFQTFWGGLIVRNHFDEDVINFGRRWAMNIMRFSRRDQLSLPIALTDFPRNKLAKIEGSDEESLLHIRLTGNSKPREYILGDRLLSPAKRSLRASREELYLAEIRSLRKLLGSRILNMAKHYLGRP